jgi:hypothetical protein
MTRLGSITIINNVIKEFGSIYNLILVNVTIFIKH